MIGYTWESKKGSTLKVIDLFKNENTGRWMYIVECSVCSKDKELYPEPLIIERYAAKSRGSVPCGCSAIPKWTEYQQKIRVERVCKNKGYILEGFVEEKLGDKTHLQLYNPSSGNRCESCTVSNLLRGREDPSLRADRIKNNHTDKREGVVLSTLRKHSMYGYMSNINWNLSEGGGKDRLFVVFDCGNCKTEGNTAYLDNIAKNKISCKCKVRPSIFKNKLSKQDNLYIMKDSHTDNIKVGRSFNLEGRVKSINKTYKGSWDILLHVKGEHRYISKLEQEVLFMFSEFKIKGNTNEILLGTSLDKVVNFLKEVKGEILYYRKEEETL